MKSQRVLIVGNQGRYGKWWTEVLLRLGCEVRGYDKNTPLNCRLPLVEWASVILFTIGDNLADAVEPVKHVLRNDHLLINTASLQTKGFKVMESTPCEFVGMHVLSNVPESFSLEGVSMVICFGNRLLGYTVWLGDFLRGTGAGLLAVDSPQKHDRLMLVETNLPRVCEFMHALVLEDLEVLPIELVMHETKLGAMSHATLRRFLEQGDDIEGELLVGNPGSVQLIDSAIGKLQELRSRVVAGDKVGIANMKSKAKEYLGREFLNPG